MLVHVRHAIQKELVANRLIFRFEAPALEGRLEAFGRWFRRKHDEGDPAEPMAVQSGDRFFLQLPPAGGPLCFRLPPASGSDCRIMISPLDSLDRQWQSSMKITPRFSDDGNHIIYTELWVGRQRLLYISPESLISRTFREDLNRIVKGARPGSLIVDEAHAISEWGGRFRSAYQRIPQMVKDLRRFNPELSVVALTAATGKWVSRDIRAMLELEDRSPTLRRNLYREGISHQVAVVESPEEKEDAYERLLWHDIPALLNREGGVGDIHTTYPQYRDPYALPLGNAAGDRGNPTDIGVTERRFRDSGNRHILVHSAMGDSVADWLYRTSGIEDRLHCLRLADLPSNACEADLDQRRSRRPLCRGQVCPHGKASLCDYGKQHHLIQQSHPDIRQAFIDTFRCLDRLLESIAAGDTPARMPLPENDDGRTELALHRLSLLGVLEIFFIDYRKSPPEFNAYGFSTRINLETIAFRVLKYLVKHDISHTAAQVVSPEEVSQQPLPAMPPGTFRETIGTSVGEDGDRLVTDAWLEEAHAAEPFAAYDNHRVFFHRLAVYLPPMLHYVAENMKIMQYRRLWNLKAFLKASTCRYAGLLKAVRSVDGRWRCRACDACCPDLAFEFTAPSQTESEKEADVFLSTWLEADDVHFDRNEADALIEQYADLQDNMTARARHLLEDDPRNVKALHLVRHFSTGAEKARDDVDIRSVGALDRALSHVIHLCETDPEGRDLVQALSAMAADMDGRWPTRPGAALDTAPAEQPVPQINGTVQDANGSGF